MSTLYLETSCLLKLVLDEPDSGKVETLLDGETDIAVSSLARVEAANVLQGMQHGGQLTLRQHRRAVVALAQLTERAPFHEVPLSGDLAETALRQIESESVHCRTLDRLHLAAMAALGISRLVTNDSQQAAAAAALGFEVLGPAITKRMT